MTAASSRPSAPVADGHPSDGNGGGGDSSPPSLPASSSSLLLKAEGVDVDKTSVDLGDYVRHFRDLNLPLSAIDYDKIATIWNTPENADRLAMGGALQSCRPEYKYNFVAALYGNAKISLLDEGDAVKAKVLVLTAGLFEQCRVKDSSAVIASFGPTPPGEVRPSVETMLPYCHRARINARTEDAMRKFLTSMDLDKMKRELLEEEPTIKIRFQRPGGSTKKLIANPLLTFGNLLGAYHGEGGEEGLRIVIPRGGINDGLSIGAYFPFAKCLTLEALGVRNLDNVTVRETDLGSEIVADYLLTNNGCFDQSVKYWMPRTLVSLFERTSSISSNEHWSLFQAVLQFWTEPGTGRREFLSPDTHMVGSLPDGDEERMIAIAGQSYSEVCYGHAQRALASGNLAHAKAYALTATLIEVSLLTDVGKLLSLSQEEIRRDRDCSRHQKYLFEVYEASQGEKCLSRFLNNMDPVVRKGKLKKASLTIRVRFFDVRTSQHHAVKACNPLVRLETLLGVHCSVSRIPYRCLRITLGDAREIDFGSNRRKTLRELGICDGCVLNLEDSPRRPHRTMPWSPQEVPKNGLLEEFVDTIAEVAMHHIKSSDVWSDYGALKRLGEEGCILTAVARYFAPSEKMKLISADEIDKLEVTDLFDALVRVANGFHKEGALVEAKGMVAAIYIIQQCLVTGTREVITYLSLNEFSSSPTQIRKKLEGFTLLLRFCVVMNKPIARVLEFFASNLYSQVNFSRSVQPRINVVFSNRSGDIDRARMVNENSHITFSRFVRKHTLRGEDGSPPQSLRIMFSGHRVILSLVGKMSLSQLGLKDNDVVVVEDTGRKSANGSSGNARQTKGKTNKANPKKKNGKARASGKNKPRVQISVPQTEEEIRKEHSRMMTPVFEQMEHDKLRQIRLKLNRLSIKKMSAKDRKSSKEQKVDAPPVFHPPDVGLEAKAGRVMFSVIVGNSDHLYKSSKSTKASQHRPVCVFDLHGCTASEAIAKLNRELLAWTDAAMREETFTIPVDIVCGGGHQILAQVVERWIRNSRQVANRPKGFV